MRFSVFWLLTLTLFGCDFLNGSSDSSGPLLEQYKAEFHKKNSVHDELFSLKRKCDVLKTRYELDVKVLSAKVIKSFDPIWNTIYNERVRLLLQISALIPEALLVYQETSTSFVLDYVSNDLKNSWAFKRQSQNISDAKKIIESDLSDKSFKALKGFAFNDRRLNQVLVKMRKQCSMKYLNLSEEREIIVDRKLDEL